MQLGLEAGDPWKFFDVSDEKVTELLAFAQERSGKKPSTSHQLTFDPFGDR